MPQNAPEPLHVYMLAAEVRPYSTVGGLADVAAALPQALAELGVQVRVISPLYRQSRIAARLRKIGPLPEVAMDRQFYSAALYADFEQDAPRNFFIENDGFFDRDGIYADPATGEPYSDAFDRFNFFMLASLEAIKILGKPHLIHCHDFHSALVPAYLKLSKMGEPFFKGVSTLLTIHNLAYQGVFEAEKFALTGLPRELFYPLGPFEFYGKLNVMKAGICYADILTTVSTQYAREIQSEAYGCGLESVLQRRRDDLYGILNGIDTREWNPETDPLIFANYSAGNLGGKKVNKAKLQDLCGFAPRGVPLIGMISRLVDQKGFDLILEAADEICRLDCQWVVLGTGLKKYQEGLKKLAHRNPEKFAVYLEYDTALAHRIEAGCDMFLMPSRFEPCGLNQLYSMRYGTIPIVRHTGGLVDTVEDFDASNGSGTGFRFYEYHSRELLSVLRRAIHHWHDRKVWKHLMRNAMAQDFSWERSARSYVELYHKALSR